MNPRTRWWVALLALAAAATRLPGLTTPPRPDESGFTLVARTWHPEAHSLYGFFWVDRPPQLLAFVKLTDAVGGFHALRFVGAACVALLVWLSARVGLLLGERWGADPDRLARWAAGAALATVGSAWIDPGVTKGEVLALPLTMAAVWATLEFIQRPRWWLPFLAGLAASLGFGFKQNLVDGAVFAGLLLLGTLGRRAWRPLAWLALGALVPVVVTIAWAWWAGVDLGELAYVVIGFRADASRVIAAQGTYPDGTASRLWLTWLTTCLFVVPVVLVVIARRVWRRDRALAAAVVGLLVWEYAGMVLGGSSWPTYLYGVVPGSVLVLTCAVALPRERIGRAGVAVVALATLVSVISWVGGVLTGAGPPPAAYVGEAIEHSAQPGDTVVSYGGRADILYVSGLTTPYRFIWSLPMRVLDPHLAQLRSVLAGPQAPTWVVLSIPLDSWNIPEGADVQRILDQRYRLAGSPCGWPVYLLDGQSRPPVDPGDCTRPWLSL